MYGIAEIAIECRRIIMRARIRFPLYVAVRFVKVLPPPLISTYDKPPGSGKRLRRIRAWRSVRRKIRTKNDATEQAGHTKADEGNR